MSFNHVTIGTNDMKGSVEFYTGQLNFEIDKRYRTGKSSEIIILKHKMDILEIVSVEGTCVYESEGYKLAMNVEGLDDILHYCNLKQIEVLVAPVYLEKHKKMMVIKDRNGLKIELFEDVND